MKAYLDSKKGKRVRIIIDQNQQKQPVHYYDGHFVTLLEGGIIILRDQHLGEIAINPEQVVAIQSLEPVEKFEPGMEIE